MSRVNRRSSPSPRWRTTSGSSGHKIPQASQILFHRDSFKRAGPSDLPPDNYLERRFPVPSHGLGFAADLARRRSSFPTASSSPPRNFQSERHPSLSSKNQKCVEASSCSKTYFKPLRDNTTRPFSSPSKFQSFLNNNKSKEYFSGMKRPSDLKDYVDLLPAKQPRRNMEDRRLQSRSAQFSSSNVLWCAPPCRQRTRSTERKSDSVLHGSRSEKSCPDRDSTLNRRQAHMNLKIPCQADDGHDRLNSKDSRGQHRPSWRQFPSEELSGNLEINHHWSEVQQRCSPRSHKKSGEGTIHHEERRNSFESRRNIQHSNCAGQSSKLHYKLEYRNGISSTHNNKYERGRSSTFNNRQDDDRCQGTSFSNERDAYHKSKTRESQRQHDSPERKSRDGHHQQSRSSTRSKRSSSIESFCEVDHSWPNIVPQERSRSQSSSSVKRRRLPSVDKDTIAPSDRSVDGGRSADSPFSSCAAIKAKVPEFNPDYVVIIRRANEGAKPLCLREEFSGKSSMPVNNDEQLPVAAENFNGADGNTSASMLLVNKRQKDDCSNSELSPVKLIQAMHRVEEKAGELMNTKSVTAAFHKSSRSLTDTKSTLIKKDVADERAWPDSIGEQRNQEKPNPASKSAEGEASVTSTKSAFDLRQKIAERRQLRTGRNTSTRIVRQWPNRWKNLPQTTGFQLKQVPDTCKCYVQKYRIWCVDHVPQNANIPLLLGKMYPGVRLS